jgi:superfamily II DNA or RNA helicase/HKD family nuclease
MTKEKLAEIRNGFETAYVDETFSSNLAYKPQFVSNNYKEGKKVISTIENELLECDEFQISVAFITMGGITPLLQTLRELEKKNIHGEILTTNYLNFSEPNALDKLNEFKNITIKMFDVEAAAEGFHTKGYIFKKEEIYRIIIGSSNITSAALTINREWNTKVISTEQGEMAQAILSEFHEIWESRYSLGFDEFYENYKERYAIIKRQRKIANKDEITSIEKYQLKPNSMQVGFITNLRKILAAGETRALLISATGTGKTYASAFAMRELEYKKVLFLVHRNQIAKQAEKSFRKVFGDSVTMGMISGALGRADYDKDYIFATIQTFSKDDTLQHFAKDHFDVIIYDEAHHITADSYKKVMDYFTPQFTLGMTATPDKRDDNMEGKNIYEIFNNQIAYEIRLQDAMEEKLLCTFHYFGITDLNVISDTGKTREERVKNFRFLTSDERVENVIANAKYFGYSGDRVKGLIFCSRIDEAKTLSFKFNQSGLRTEVLTGSDSEIIRASAIERLAGEDGDDALDYILSVDIFSEGVDVPEINQIIMLRPTQSPIVFIQQLGRGLRKAENKDYVVVLDFIGNYTNNFMIPIALSGDRSFNKDNIRRYVAEGGRAIPGESTVHFDEISRKKIYQAIDNANFSDVKLIKENYISLKHKLGRIPALADFDKYGEMDVLRIFDNNSLGSYYKFLVKYEKEYKVRLTENEEKVVEFISKKLANGKRIYELELLNRMLSYRQGLIGKLKQTLQEEYATQMNDNSIDGLIKIMTNEFQPESSKKNYESCVFVEKESTKGEYGISKSFEQMLNNIDFYNIIKELVTFGISRYKINYRNRYQDTDFVLYQKYTYEDVCRILGWKKNLSSVMNGYLLDKQTKTFPVFVNYDKTESISDTTKYEDHFISANKLIAISKSGRKINSEDVQNFLHARERGIDVQLFVRKNKDDKISKEFYYLGRMHASGLAKEFTMVNTDKKAVEIEWILDTPVREDVYEYIVRG